ncbi:MAG: hypothetical protein HYU36_13395 [Planctomycetes bacterium]|nr:hypothetical protein [Planctomycetota bacterium]
MAFIYPVLALTQLGFLILQVASGMARRPDHALSGLAVSLLGCLLHSLVLTYFIGTGRSIKDAVQRGELHPDFYLRSKRWYRSSAFLLTLATLAVLVLAAALGAAADRSYATAWAWLHPACGWLALLLHVTTFPLQNEQITRNSGLISEANRVLEHPGRGLEAPEDRPRKAMPAGYWAGRLLMYAGTGAWLPFIVLRYAVNGPFGQLSPWPFLAAYFLCVSCGLVLWRVFTGRHKESVSP